MEDAILGNSKGATYKSFILDVEIVIKKEGTANISEGRVKSRNTRENNEETQGKGQRSTPERNKKQDVYVVSADQTNLRDIDKQPKNGDLLVGKSNVLNKKTLYAVQQKGISVETNISDVNNPQKYKSFLSHETNFSETSSEKHHKKKRTHKSAHSKMFKGTVEPVDFLECNRIYTCNYLQLPRQNSDSALYCNQLGAQQECIFTLYERLKNARSVDEITSLLKPNNSVWNGTTNKQLSSYKKRLGNIYSCGDCNITNNIERCEGNFHKLYFIKNMNKTGVMNIELLHNYLNNKFWREQAIRRNKDQLLTNENNDSLEYNLSSENPPNFRGETTLEDRGKVESSPNVNIQCKHDKDNFIPCLKDSVQQELTDSTIPARKYVKSQRVKVPSNLGIKGCITKDNEEKGPEFALTKEVVEIKKNYSKRKAMGFLQRIKSVRKGFPDPINLYQMSRRILKKL